MTARAADVFTEPVSMHRRRFVITIWIPGNEDLARPGKAALSKKRKGGRNYESAQIEEIKMLNKVIIAGRLVREPDMKRMESGIAICNFTLAVEDDFRNAYGEKTTDFFDCVAWRQPAEFAGRYLTKGCLIVVVGKMKSAHYTDKNGNKRTSWTVSCDTVYSMEPKRDVDSTYTPSQPLFADIDDNVARFPF